jgi:Zn-dependent peptidase ImmA (M78 family)
MNTVLKGDAFELRFLKILRKMLREQKMKVIVEGGKEWSIPPFSEATNKKAYFYPWGNKVIIDIAVEVKNDEDKNTDIVLIECKDYGSAIKIEKIQAFISKVSDLKAKKGIFVTTSKFQKGAIDAARVHNIALIRVSDNDGVRWDLHRLGCTNSLSYLNIVEQLTSDKMDGESLIIDGCNSYTSVADALTTIMDSEEIFATKPTFITEEVIKNKVETFLDSPNFTNINNATIIGQALNHGIDVDVTSDCNGMMGCCNFNKRSVFVNRNLMRDQHRYRFTLAHEIGHIVLQSDMLKDVISGADDMEIRLILGSKTWQDRLEYQANIFASKLLIPEIPFINLYFKMKSKRGYELTKPLYLDFQECNNNDCNVIITALSNVFNVSKEVIYIKMLQENLLIDVRPNNKLDNILLKWKFPI